MDQEASQRAKACWRWTGHEVFCAAGKVCLHTLGFGNFAIGSGGSLPVAVDHFANAASLLLFDKKACCAVSQIAHKKFQAEWHQFLLRQPCQFSLEIGLL